MVDQIYAGNVSDVIRDASYDAFLISTSGKRRRQFAIVNGDDIPRMFEQSTSPNRLMFIRVS